MSIAVSVDGIGKQFRIGAARSNDTLRDLIGSLPRTLMRRSPKREEPTIWALQDVTFEIPQGQAVGIVGSNGSGKSTLLKILSRITEPTTGRARIRGRVGALLEVGTGFHPELTGRENVFANGAILGMSKVEIMRKFDAIVDFAGVETFIDTPVKHYSSGMRLRLAFSVAAHLEPEILIIDEVLAVGDAEFQKRCLGRMNEVAKDGRTILFVSHQLEMVMGLCDRAIWLDRGKVRADGTPNDTIRSYVQSTSDMVRGTSFAERPDRSGDGPLTIRAIELVSEDGVAVSQLRLGERPKVRIAFDSRGGSEPIKNPEMKLVIEDLQGRRITCLSPELTGQSFSTLPPCGVIECSLDRLALAPGTYRLSFNVNIARRVVSDRLYSALEFDVIAGDYFGSGQPIADPCVVLTPQSWRLVP